MNVKYFCCAVLEYGQSVLIHWLWIQSWVMMGSALRRSDIIFILLHRGQSWRRGTKCDCKIDWLWTRSSLEELNEIFFFHIFALVWRQSAALSSATQQAMPSKLGEKWEMECLNTRMLLPTLLCAGCSVKLIMKILHILLQPYS